MALCSIRCEDKTIADKVFLADTFFSRLTGLLNTDSLETNEGLLLSPCRQIHSFGMKFYIDALFLNKEMQIIDIYEFMPPGRKSKYYPEGQMVLELPAGTAKNYNLIKGLKLVKQKL